MRKKGTKLKLSRETLNHVQGAVRHRTTHACATDPYYGSCDYSCGGTCPNMGYTCETDTCQGCGGWTDPCG